MRSDEFLPFFVIGILSHEYHATLEILLNID